MPKTFFLFCFLFSCSVVFSQTPFEGKIIFKLTTEEENQSGRLELLYGKDKIKGEMKRSGPEAKKDDIIIIDFSKGIIYEINDSAKKYSIRQLKSPDNNLFVNYRKTEMKKMILGQPCSAFSFIDTTEKSDFIGDMDFMFWYADSLFYPVNEKYMHSDDIPIFTNGKNIGMGMTAKMKVIDKATFFDLQPIEIIPMPLADSLFTLPRSYILKQEELEEGKKTIDPGSIPAEDIEVKMRKIEEIKSGDAPPPPPPPPPAPASAKKKKKGKS